jgi:hypothetical protein
MPQKATEIMVFMASDLNRLQKYRCGHLLPIAYGLHVNSVKAETVREMLEDVLQTTEIKGLYPYILRVVDPSLLGC